MLTSDPSDVLMRCEGCDRELKTGALFCTDCGTRVAVEGKSNPNECASCQNPLRPGAEFCTECGTSVADIDLTAAQPEGTLAAAAGQVADKTAESENDEETQSVDAKERVSPAASRAILGSVGGGMGSYLGKQSSGAAPPPVLPAAAVAAENRRRRNLVLAIASVLLVVIAGVAILLATQKDSGAKLRVGQVHDRIVNGKRVKGNSGSKASDSSGTSDDAKGSTTASDTTGAPGTAGSATTGTSGSAKTHGGKSSGSSGGKSTSGSGSTAGGSSGGKAPSGGGSHGTPTNPTNPRGPVGPVTTRPGPPIMTVYGTINLSPSQNRGSVRITNSGGQTLSWSTGVNGVPGGVSVSPSSGSISPGQSAYPTVTWDPTGGTVENYWSGQLNINSNGGNASAALNLDGRAPDSVYLGRVPAWADGQPGCKVNPHDAQVCDPGSAIQVTVMWKAQGSLNPSYPTTVNYSFTGGPPQTAEVLSTPSGSCGSGSCIDVVFRTNIAIRTSTTTSSCPASCLKISVTDAAGVTGPPAFLGIGKW